MLAISALLLCFLLFTTFSQGLPNNPGILDDSLAFTQNPAVEKRQTSASPASASPTSVSTSAPLSVTPPSATTTVTYTGTPIIGTAHLPASMSKILFPSDLPWVGFPKQTASLGNNALSQAQTNGNSLLGTLLAQTFLRFIGDILGLLGAGSLIPPPSGFPWGLLTAAGTNPYTNAPTTGIVRSYNFVVSRGIIAPDGVERSALLINGGFPGPTIEANWGDTIQVTVTNNITGPEEGTALHWHALLQKGTPYEDGVPASHSITWYHSHYSAQYAGGALGPIIIHGPLNAAYDQDLGPFTLVEQVMGTNLAQVAPPSVNNLIDGKGVFDCAMTNLTCTPNEGLSKPQFTSGRSYRLRLINAGAEGIQRFSIDEHVLQVIAYDLVPIQPYTTNVVTLGIGQRADVIVHANGSRADTFWMRSTISSTCSVTNQPNGLAIVYYQNANTNTTPNSTAWPIDDSRCANDPLNMTLPYEAITPPSPDTTVNIALNFEINATGHFLWTMNDSTFRVNYNDPILLLADAGNDSYPYDPEWNVYKFGTNKSFVIVINNQSPVAHPMHIHGHNMYVLHEGVGSWDGSTVRPNNPMRRDVQLLQPSGYIAIEVVADNPSVWPFHCHIAWHVSGGLYVNILERPDLILSQVKVLTSANNLCTSWNAFTSKDMVDQIDSGL
ncbi:Cupredoxin [Exophiala viscosa]|uniref:Cupredoxin n=1 Tax=Exophiala viscosa TaxID=2486360 RepID=A0AAN6DNI5_9EURO|nr:Cupredoxin [Exophiala viscosa]